MVIVKYFIIIYFFEINEKRERSYKIEFKEIIKLRNIMIERF